jgi:hypothetical protein
MQAMSRIRPRGIPAVLSQGDGVGLSGCGSLRHGAAARKREQNEAQP